MNFNDGTPIEDFQRPYFIAELNTSHFGKLDTAKRMIDAAREAGCDCVKFQSWSAETLYSQTYYRRNPVARRFVDKFSFAPEALAELAEYAIAQGIAFASTPYSREEVDFLLQTCRVPFIKIASMEIDNLPYLDYIARSGSAIVLSTGMAELAEIERAVDCILSTGNRKLCLLHCVSIYPAAPETINLNNLPMLRARFPGIPVGYSDHTLGLEVPIAAIALGAPVIEKHFTLDAGKIGMDNQMATEPAAFKQMIDSCRLAWRALGSHQRQVSVAEKEQRINMRRSIVTRHAIAAGQPITAQDIDFKRPGDGFSPPQSAQVVGRRAICDIAADEIIYPDMIE